MVTNRVRCRMGALIHSFSVREELVVGRVLGLKKIRDQGQGLLIFAGILARGRLHKVLVPSLSPLYSHIFKLQGQMVQAVIETIVVHGTARSRLIAIEPYTPQSFPLFAEDCFP